MPVKERPKFKPDEIVVAVESFVTSCLPSGPLPVSAGSRWKASHEVVKRNADLFAADGTPQDELARQRARIYMRAEADAHAVEAPTTRIDRSIPDKDALVAIRPAGVVAVGTGLVDQDGWPLTVPTGARVHKRSRIAKADPDAFVVVVPAGLDPKNAVAALQRLEHTYEDGTLELVHQGTLVPRDHPAVTRHPSMFELPAIDPTEGS